MEYSDWILSQVNRRAQGCH